MSEPRIDAAALWAHVEAIASWSREAGSEGEARTFDYIADQLERSGAATTRRRMPAFVSLPRRAELTLADAPLAAITHAMAAATTPGGVVAPLALASATQADGWRGAAVVFAGLALPESVRRAQRAGAAAALFASADRIAHEMIVSSVWGSPGPDDLARLPSIPVASVGGDDARALRAAAARGEPARLVTEVDSGWRELPLLVADVRAPSAPDEQFVLFSGHVDSWHRGAMDNAGANAVMLEIARAAHARRDALRRHLRVAFWSGHSQARYAGSASYVDEHWEELERHCAVHVNIDSVGGRGATLLTEAPAMADTERVGAEAIRRISGQRLAGRRPGRAGDQSLANLGVSSLFLTLSEQPAGGEDALRDGIAALTTGEPATTGGLGWWWHTPQDTPDKLDPLLLRRDADIYRLALAALTTDPVLPLDVAASAAELTRLLRELAERCHGRFDLDAVLARATAVEASAAAVMRGAERVRRSASRDAAASLSRALVAAARPLNRVAHASADRFAHDDAAAAAPLPLLRDVAALVAAPPGSPEEHALRIMLTRRRNRVVAELATAARALERALELTADDA